MSQKKKTIGEKISDAAHSIADSVDHALHPDSSQDEGTDVESGDELADEVAPKNIGAGEQPSQKEGEYSGAKEADADEYETHYSATGEVLGLKKKSSK